MRHPQVDGAHRGEECRPAPVHGAPRGFGQFHLPAHERADEVLAEEQLTDQQRAPHQPVEDGGFPLDEGVAVGEQRGAAEHHDHAEADPLHRFDPAVPYAQVGDLGHGGGDRHGRGRVDAPDLEGHEEQDDGEEVDQQFHRWGRAVAGSSCVCRAPSQDQAPSGSKSSDAEFMQ